MIEFTQKIIQPGEIFNLREISVDDLGKAAAKLAKADAMTVIDRQEYGAFDYFAVLSAGTVYEVTRMGFFVRCTCPNFTEGHAICKHIACGLSPICRSCFKRNAPELGGQCELCGPGELLPVGVQFKCEKYYGKRAIMEVAEIDIERDEVICYDAALPESSSIERPRNYFKRRVLDAYRIDGSLTILDRAETI